MPDTVTLAKELIKRPSITPNDEGCQALMCDRLKSLGFNIEHLPFEDVDNFWATHGKGKPVLAFAGHTDVVPTGPLDEWEIDPFKPEIKNNHLYGRGAADMKSSLAAMITACERFLNEHKTHKGTIAFLITSDEEGPSINGTVKVINHLEKTNRKIDYCIVGEPTSKEKLGDIIKNGRRGSLNGALTIKGIQGHIAYPQLAKNPVHLAMAALDELCKTAWDNGNTYFPPTSFQISNINAGTGAENVIPGDLFVDFNFRFSTEATEESLKRKVESCLEKHGLDFDITWRLSGNPFITPVAELTNAVSDAIQEVLGYSCTLSTDGGTSDGRFIAPTGAQVIELGPLNDTIHKINECVSVEDIKQLSFIYKKTLENLLT